MSKEMKNIIILRNIYSQFFEEVIFVLKNEDLKGNKNLVFEARKIIEDYIDKKDMKTKQKNSDYKELKGMERGTKLNIILNISLILSMLIFAIMLAEIF